MKKMILVLLCAVLAIFPVACGETSEELSSSNQDVQASETITSSGGASDETSSSAISTSGEEISDETSSSATSTDEIDNSDSVVSSESQNNSDTDDSNDQQGSTSTDISGSTCSHDFAEATCTTAQTCKKCGTTNGKALGHNWKDATCTTPKTCQRCNTTEGKAKGHSLGAWSVTKAATCDANGSQTRTCACGFSETQTITPTGHQYKDATCTEPKTCSKCNATAGSALGHNYSGASCSRCGETRTSYKIKLPSYYVSDDSYSGKIATISQDGKIDIGFMVMTVHWDVRDEKYFVETNEGEGGYYKIPEAVYIDALRKVFDFPDNRIPELKAETPYYHGLVTYKDGYFYDELSSTGGDIGDFEHEFVAYTAEAGILTLYFDYGSFDYDWDLGKFYTEHLSYYKMVYTYSGVWDAQNKVSNSYYTEVQSYDKSLADSMRLTAVYEVASIPANAIPVK